MVNVKLGNMSYCKAVQWYIWAVVNVRLVNLSHGKCEFGKYELLYSCSLVNLRVVNLLFGTNELAPKGTIHHSNDICYEFPVIKRFPPNTLHEAKQQLFWDHNTICKRIFLFDAHFKCIRKWKNIFRYACKEDDHPLAFWGQKCLNIQAAAQIPPFCCENTFSIP